MTRNEDELLSSFLSHQPLVRKLLAARTNSWQDAEDLAQEAWIKLARNSAAAITAPLPYLLRIVGTLAVDHNRGRKRRLTSAEVTDLVSIPDTTPGPDRQVEDLDQVRCLARIIDELPERQRHILKASRLHRRTHSDIAAELGVSVRTVELEIRRAVEYCGDRLQQINGA